MLQMDKFIKVKIIVYSIPISPILNSNCPLNPNPLIGSALVVVTTTHSFDLTCKEQI